MSSSQIIETNQCKLPNELWPIIFAHAQNPALGRVSQLFHTICDDKTHTLSYLKRLHHYISPLLNLEDKSEIVLENVKPKLLEILSGKISEKAIAILSTKDKTLSIPVFMKIFLEEKAFNLIQISPALLQPLAIQLEKDSKNLSLLQRGDKIRDLLHSEEMQPIISSTTDLDLKWKKLTLVPEELDLFTGLKSLDLDCNALSYLPSSFGSNWEQLQQVSLRFNQLASIPPSFGDHWTALKSLSINDNPLKDLPEDFGSSWKNLLFLRIEVPSLSESMIKSVKVKFPKLIKLT